MTNRTALAGARLALAMLTAAACVPLNEAMNSRDLECTGVPDDMCVRLADDTVGQYAIQPGFAEFGPIVRVLVKPRDCRTDRRYDPSWRGCWEVEGFASGIADGDGAVEVMAGYYRLLGDGTLVGYEDRVVGD